MNSIKSKVFLAIMVGAVLMTAACSDDDPTTPANENDVTISNLSSLGSVLVDDMGITLYFFTKDVNGESTCEGRCLDAWPAFYRADISVSSDLNANDFGVITRADGSRQTTYKGWPLYYFGDDAAANEANGEGSGGVWFVAKPDYTLMLANQELDGSALDYFVDPTGNALYFFTNDENDISNCTGGCLTAWPVFNGAKDAIVPSTLNAADFGQIDGNDGSKQMTFKGNPIYYFAQDQNRGDTNGRDVSSWSLTNF